MNSDIESIDSSLRVAADPVMLEADAIAQRIAEMRAGYEPRPVVDLEHRTASVTEAREPGEVRVTYSIPVSGAAWLLACKYEPVRDIKAYVYSDSRLSSGRDGYVPSDEACITYYLTGRKGESERLNNEARELATEIAAAVDTVNAHIDSVLAGLEERFKATADTRRSQMAAKLEFLGGLDVPVTQ